MGWQGDWRGISRHYVLSRNPTQVASHAQKYFIRQSNLNKRKRRSSLFDIVSDVVRARDCTSQPWPRLCRFPTPHWIYLIRSDPRAAGGRQRCLYSSKTNLDA